MNGEVFNMIATLMLTRLGGDPIWDELVDSFSSVTVSRYFIYLFIFFSANTGVG